MTSQPFESELHPPGCRGGAVSRRTRGSARRRGGPRRAPWLLVAPGPRPPWSFSSTSSRRARGRGTRSRTGRASAPTHYVGLSELPSHLGLGRPARRALELAEVRSRLRRARQRIWACAGSGLDRTASRVDCCARCSSFRFPQLAGEPLHLAVHLRLPGALDLLLGAIGLHRSSVRGSAIPLGVLVDPRRDGLAVQRACDGDLPGRIAGPGAAR